MQTRHTRGIQEKNGGKHATLVAVILCLRTCAPREQSPAWPHPVEGVQSIKARVCTGLPSLATGPGVNVARGASGAPAARSRAASSTAAASAAALPHTLQLPDGRPTITAADPGDCGPLPPAAGMCTQNSGPRRACITSRDAAKGSPGRLKRAASSSIRSAVSDVAVLAPPSSHSSLGSGSTICPSATPPTGSAPSRTEHMSACCRRTHAPRTGERAGSRTASACTALTSGATRWAGSAHSMADTPRSTAK
eukprot:352598-Chlamydomonas_euryale.AAC.23